MTLNADETLDEFRTASRLIEMRSRDYFSSAHAAAQGDAGDLGGLVDG